MPWPNSTLNAFADQQFFLQHGDTAYWYQAQLCSCGTNPGAPSDVARAVTTCKVCGGLGRFYPGTPVFIRGIISNAMQDREILAAGMAVSSEDLVWSADPYSQGPISPYDLIIFTGDPHTWPFEGQVVKRGNGTTDSTWYTASELVSVTVSDPTTGNVTDYTESGVTLSGKTVDWSNATTSPAANTAYSVKYRAQYEWVAFAPPLVRFEHSQSLGQKVLLRKRHIVVNSALSSTNGTFLQA